MMQIMLINTAAVAAYLTKALHLTAIPMRSIAAGVRRNKTDNGTE